MMMAGRETVERTKAGARSAAVQQRPWIEGLGRLGYAAKGVVYGLVGFLAALAASDHGGDTTDTTGALAWIVEAPFGQVLLAIIAIGLLGYALLRLLAAFFDSESHGSDSKGMAVRAGYVFTSAAYGGLAFTAARLAMGSGASGGSDQRAQDWSARLLAQPWGAPVIGLAGVAVVGFGLFQLYRAATADFCESLDVNALSASQQRWVERAGRVGHAARGIVFGMIGAFLLYAAWQDRAEEARGLGGALATLAAQPAGPWLLGIVAAGLIAYGVYCLVEARCRRLRVA
jgi:hypothetical protein